MTSAVDGFVHQAGLYEGTDGLVALVGPFVEAGLAAGDEIVVALGDAHARAVREAVPDTPAIAYLTDGYACPAGTAAAMADVFRARAASPARTRLVGELPPEALAHGAWSPWARYEAASNRLFASFAATALCAYDTAAAAPGVLAEVEATHPRMVTADQARANDRYQDPATFIAGRQVPADPIQRSSPVCDLADPDARTARNAVRTAAAERAVSQSEVDGLALGVSEVVTNAHMHGRPPVGLRLWAAPDRLVAVVSDGGDGPTDPLVGLAQRDSLRGGRGLWLTHQVCGQADHLTGPEGFAVRLATSPPRG